MSQTPITDAELAALDVMYAAMQPPDAGLHESWNVQGHGSRASYIYPACFPCDGWIEVTGDKRVAVADGIVALRNSYAALRERLRVAEAGRDAERESCAALAESEELAHGHGGRATAREIAAAIRARAIPSETHP